MIDRQRRADAWHHHKKVSIQISSQAMYRRAPLATNHARDVHRRLCALMHHVKGIKVSMYSIVHDLSQNGDVAKKRQSTVRDYRSERRHGGFTTSDGSIRSPSGSGGLL